MLCRVLAHARRIAVAVAVGVLVSALGAEPAAAKFPAGLVFAHKRAVDVEWRELQEGVRLQLCNTGEADTLVKRVFDGFKFMQNEEPVQPEMVLSTKRVPRSWQLAAGDCDPVTLKADGEVDNGTYSGTFAYVGKGAGIARVRVTFVKGAPGKPTARTHVKVEETEHGGLRVAAVVRLHLPRDTPGLAEVIVADEEQDLEEAIDALLDELGMSGVFYSRYLPGPRLVLNGQAARLTIQQPQDLYSFDSVSDRAEEDHSGGDVRLTRDGKRMRLTLAGPDAPPRIAWVAQVKVRGEDQRQRTPPPQVIRGDLVRWSFPAGAKTASPSVTFNLDEDIERNLLLGNKVPRALQAGSFFVAEALFVFLLLLLLVGDRRGGRPRERLRSVGWAAIALLAGMLGVWLIQTLVVGVRWRDSSDSPILQFLHLFGQIGAPLAGAAFLMLVARKRDDGYDRGGLLAAGGLLVFAAVVTGAVVSRTVDDPYPGPLAWEPIRWLLAASGALLVFALCVLVLGASAEIVRRSWPAGAIRARADRIPRSWLWAGVLGLAAVATGQWTWAVAKRYEDAPPLEIDDQALSWWEALAGDIGFFPLGMLGRLVQLLPLLLAIAALPLMLRYAGSGVSEASFGKRDRPIRLLILVFGGVVAGTAGALEGFRVPIALIVSVVLLHFVLRDRDDGGGTGPLARPRRQDLIKKALRREEYRRDQQNLYGQLDAGEKTLNQYRVALDALPRPPEDTDPLSRGVFDDWWQNAVAAVRIGALLSIVPVAYYVGVIVVNEIGDDLSATADWGVLDLLVGLLAEEATWIVAAFVFGGLYAHLPFQQGPAKGAVLSLVFAAGLGLSAGLLHGDGSWLFRWLQMFLFLGVLGFLIDRRTVEEHGFYWRELFDLYRVREARFAAGYGSTLALALVGVFQQILSGDASQTITALIEAAGGAVPDPTA